MIPFKVQFDKLTEAYISNKVNPYINCACFIGNLLDGDRWAYIRKPRGCRGHGEITIESIFFRDGQNYIIGAGEGTYTTIDIMDMENNFLRILAEKLLEGGAIEADLDSIDPNPSKRAFAHPDYEDALFEAFSSTLDMLKAIHERNGEKVDDFNFNKRVLSHDSQGTATISR